MFSRTLLRSTRSTLGRRSISAEVGQPMQASKLEVHQTTSPKPKIAKDKLTFGTTFTDHMLEIDWTSHAGWSAPQIRPYGPFTMDPASMVLHYALECFEGMKAYKDAQGRIRLFRPDMNMKRLNTSMERLLLPQVDEAELIECIKRLVRLDHEWIPEGDGYSLYIRPSGIGTHPYLGLGTSLAAKVFVICSPVGSYYDPKGFKPVTLYANDSYVRAWPGGTGGFKLGANYAPSIVPQADAWQKGHSQNLWIFGPDHDITEVGTMNIFVHWINEDGEVELVTPSLTRGDILPGITRDSVLTLTRDWNEFKVSEKNITMKQLKKAVHENRVLEVFGSGTSAVVSPVSMINYMDEDLTIPLTGTGGTTGKVAERIWKTLTDIQYGRVEHPWSVLVE